MELHKTVVIPSSISSATYLAFAIVASSQFAMDAAGQRISALTAADVKIFDPSRFSHFGHEVSRLSTYRIWRFHGYLVRKC